MKLSKILFGAVAAAAVMGLVSCGEVDDPNKMIKGSGSKYTIDYSNVTEDTEGSSTYNDNISRGYRATAYKHAGGLVKISIDSSSDKKAGVMGFIFDLKKNSLNSNAKDFFVIGIRNDNKYYVSKFMNVTDLQAYNFGTEDEDNPAVEYAFDESGITTNTGLKNLNSSLPTDEETGAQYAYVYAYCDASGNFNWAILNASATDKVKSLSDKEFAALEFEDSMYLAHGTIEATYTGYDEQTQNNLAVYANVYPTKTLTGEWNFVGTYKEAEVIE